MDKFPLSPQQEKYLKSDRILQQNRKTTFWSPFVAEIVGQMDFSLFKQAIHHLVQNLDILRSSFFEEDGRYYQAIQANVEYGIKLSDLKNASQTEQDQAIKNALVEIYHRERTDYNAPLWEVELFTLSESKHVLVFTAHHAIADGFGFAILMDTISKYYGALAEGKTPLRPSLQYSDYINDYEQRLKADDFKDTVEIWSGLLPSASHSPGTRKIVKNSQRTLSIGSELLAQIKDVCNGNGIFFSSFLYASYCLILNKKLGRDEMLVEALSIGRSDKKFAGTFGCFTASFPIVVKFPPEFTLLEIIAPVNELVITSLGHEFPPHMIYDSSTCVSRLNYMRAIGPRPERVFDRELNYVVDLNRRMESGVGWISSNLSSYIYFIEGESGLNLYVRAPEDDEEKNLLAEWTCSSLRAFWQNLSHKPDGLQQKWSEFCSGTIP